MLVPLLHIISVVLKFVGMQGAKRREIKKAILRDAIAYEKHAKASGRLRGEYRELLEEIRRENNEKATNQRR